MVNTTINDNIILQNCIICEINNNAYKNCFRNFHKLKLMFYKINMKKQKNRGNISLKKTGKKMLEKNRIFNIKVVIGKNSPK